MQPEDQVVRPHFFKELVPRSHQEFACSINPSRNVIPNELVKTVVGREGVGCCEILAEGHVVALGVLGNGR